MLATTTTSIVIIFCFGHDTTKQTKYQPTQQHEIWSGNNFFADIIICEVDLRIELRVFPFVCKACRSAALIAQIHICCCSKKMPCGCSTQSDELMLCSRGDHHSARTIYHRVYSPILYIHTTSPYILGLLRPKQYCSTILTPTVDIVVDIL